MLWCDEICQCFIYSRVLCSAKLCVRVLAWKPFQIRDAGMAETMRSNAAMSALHYPPSELAIACGSLLLYGSLRGLSDNEQTRLLLPKQSNTVRHDFRLHDSVYMLHSQVDRVCQT